MNKQQMQKFRTKLGNSQCPICNVPLLKCYSIVSRDTITEQEEICYSPIDTSKDFIDIKCEHCGYMMSFNTELLLK
ncbi:hypothetical protein F070042J6_30330 [Bacteroides sp. f07]